MAKPNELDPTPLVLELVKKSTEKKLQWEPTADRKAFVVSLGGDKTLKICKVQTEDVNEYGSLETVEVPQLHMLDEKGKLLWEISQRDLTQGSLWDLFKIAQRIGNKLDQRLEDAIKALGEL